jgi:hypothetical protein
MIDSDGFYGPMEVDNELSTTLSTEAHTDRDVIPHSFDSTLGSSTNAFAYRDIRAPEVPGL